MEFEFSQDGVLNFLRSQGGRVKNAELRAYFQSYIDEPGGREKFKKHVNAFAKVTKEDGCTYVQLRRQYRGDKGSNRCKSQRCQDEKDKSGALKSSKEISHDDLEKMGNLQKCSASGEQNSPNAQPVQQWPSDAQRREQYLTVTQTEHHISSSEVVNQPMLASHPEEQYFTSRPEVQPLLAGGPEVQPLPFGEPEVWPVSVAEPEVHSLSTGEQYLLAVQSLPVERPEAQSLPAEGLNVWSLSAEGSDIQSLPAEGPEVCYLSGEGPEVGYLLAEGPEVRHLSRQGSKLGYVSGEGPEVGNQPAKGPEVEYLSAEGPKVRYFSADGPEVECLSAKGPEVGYLSAKGPEVGYLSAKGPEVGYLSAKGPEVGYLSAKGPEVGYLSAKGPEVGYLSAKGPEVGYLPANGPEVGYLSAKGPEVGYLSAKGPEVGYLSAKGPEVGSLSAEGPEIGYLSAEEPEVRYLSAAGSQVWNPLAAGPQVWYPSAERPQVGYLSAERPQVGYLSAERPQVGYLSAERPQVGYLSAERPQVEYLSAERPQVGYLSAERPQVGYLSAERPQVGYLSAERPQVGYLSAERPQVGYLSAERPEVGYLSAERPEVGYLSAERSQVGYLSAERPQVRYLSAEGPQVGYMSAEGPQVGYMSAERPQVGYMSAERPQVGYMSAERPQVGYMSAEGPQVGYVSAERPQVGYLSAVRSPVRYASVERPQVQCLSAKKSEEQYLSVEEPGMLCQKKTGRIMGDHNQTKFDSSQQQLTANQWPESSEHSKQMRDISKMVKQSNIPQQKIGANRYFQNRQSMHYEETQDSFAVKQRGTSNPIRYQYGQSKQDRIPSYSLRPNVNTSPKDHHLIRKRVEMRPVEKNEIVGTGRHPNVTVGALPQHKHWHENRMNNQAKTLAQSKSDHTGVAPLVRVDVPPTDENQHIWPGKSFVSSSKPIVQSRQDIFPEIIKKPTPHSQIAHGRSLNNLAEPSQYKEQYALACSVENLNQVSTEALAQWYKEKKKQNVPTFHSQMICARSLDNLSEPSQYKEQYALARSVENLNQVSTEALEQWYKEKKRQNIVEEMASRAKANTRRYSTDNLLMPPIRASQNKLCSSMMSLKEPALNTADQAIMVNRKMQSMDDLSEPSKMNNARIYFQNTVESKGNPSSSSNRFVKCQFVDNLGDTLLSDRDEHIIISEQCKMRNYQEPVRAQEMSRNKNFKWGDQDCLSEHGHVNLIGNTGQMSGNFGRRTTANVQNYDDEDATNSIKGTDHSTIYGLKWEEADNKARGNKMPSKNADYYEQRVWEKYPRTSKDVFVDPEMRDVESRCMPSIPPRTTFHDESPQNQPARTQGRTENLSGMVQEQYTRMKPEESPGRYFGEKHHVQFMDYPQEHPPVVATSKEACEQVVDTQYERDFKEIRYQDNKKSPNYLEMLVYVEQKLAAGNDNFYPVQQRSSQMHYVESLPSEENSHCTRSISHHYDANSQSDDAYSINERAFSKEKPEGIRDVDALHNVLYEDLRSTPAHTLKRPIYDPPQRSDKDMKLHHTQPSQDVHSGIPEAPVSTLGKASPANLPPSAEEIPSMNRWAVYAAMGEFYKLEPLVKKNITILFMKDSLSGYTALHWAAKHGFVDALTWMGKMAQSSGILLPVDVRSNGAGLTALHLAAAHGRDDAIRVLVRFLHANPSLRDYGGRKALHYLPLEMVSLQARQLLEPSPMKMLLHVPRRTSQPIKAHDQHLLSFFKPPKSPHCPRK